MSVCDGSAGATRMQVVDADLEALVVQLVRRKQALVIELVAVRATCAGFSARKTASTTPSVALR